MGGSPAPAAPPGADNGLRYALQFARRTRINSPDAPEFIKNWVAWGAGPRASQYLILGGKARAILHGRYYVSTDDIKAVAHPVLRHRVINNFSAEAEGITTDKIVDKLIDTIPTQESEAFGDSRLPNVVRPEGQE